MKIFINTSFSLLTLHLVLGTFLTCTFATNNKYYISGKVGYNWISELNSNEQTVSITDTRHIVAGGEPLKFDRTVTNDFKLKNSFDFGISLGKHFDKYRIEGEMSYFKTKATSQHLVMTTEPTNADADQYPPYTVDEVDTDIDRTLGKLSIGVNGYYDLETSTIFVPYAGLGLGLSFVSISDKFDDDNKSTKITTVGAFKFMLGTQIRCSKQFSLLFEYELTATSKFSYLEPNEKEKVQGFEDYKSGLLINSINIGGKYTIA